MDPSLPLRTSPGLPGAPTPKGLPYFSPGLAQPWDMVHQYRPQPRSGCGCRSGSPLKPTPKGLPYFSPGLVLSDSEGSTALGYGAPGSPQPRRGCGCRLGFPLRSRGSSNPGLFDAAPSGQNGQPRRCCRTPGTPFYNKAHQWHFHTPQTRVYQDHLKRNDEASHLEPSR